MSRGELEQNGTSHWATRLGVRVTDLLTAWFIIVLGIDELAGLCRAYARAWMDSMSRDQLTFAGSHTGKTKTRVDNTIILFMIHWHYSGCSRGWEPTVALPARKGKSRLRIPMFQGPPCSRCPHAEHQRRIWQAVWPISRQKEKKCTKLVGTSR